MISVEVEHSLHISEISAAEITCLVRSRKLITKIPAEEWFFTAVQKSGIELPPLSASLLTRSILMEWENKDPADRILLVLNLNI